MTGGLSHRGASLAADCPGRGGRDVVHLAGLGAIAEPALAHLLEVPFEALGLLVAVGLGRRRTRTPPDSSRRLLD
ncbi:hypothetical protein [Micromonospora maritima]|uniref:PEP-CTERM protein-sorting domain-containing protein n=1 Tax=Micromonospora maritima TaxID=986711 RepID=A0ABW7ZN53_9ACTN